MVIPPTNSFRGHVEQLFEAQTAAFCNIQSSCAQFGEPWIFGISQRLHRSDLKGFVCFDFFSPVTWQCCVGQVLWWPPVIIWSEFLCVWFTVGHWLPSCCSNKRLFEVASCFCCERAWWGPGSEERLLPAPLCWHLLLPWVWSTVNRVFITPALHRSVPEDSGTCFSVVYHLKKETL